MTVRIPEREPIKPPEQQRKPTPEELSYFKQGVYEFRPYILKVIAESQLSIDENRAISYEESDGHWKAEGSIPGPNGAIVVRFTVGLKAKPNNEGEHEPYATIAFPHQKDEHGRERTLDDFDAINPIYDEVDNHYYPEKF